MFRFGILQKKQGLTIDQTLIKDVEKILIYELEPEKNIQCKKSYNIKKDLKVENTGYRGFVPQIINTTNH